MISTWATELYLDKVLLLAIAHPLLVTWPSSTIEIKLFNLIHLTVLKIFLYHLVMHFFSLLVRLLFSRLCSCVKETLDHLFLGLRNVHLTLIVIITGSSFRDLLNSQNFIAQSPYGQRNHPSLGTKGAHEEQLK